MNLSSADCQVEELAHTSEIGLRAFAATPAALFGCLARAMIDLTGAQADETADPLLLEVDVSATDMESLLVNWLNEVLYQHEVTGLLPQTVTVHSLHATAVTATLGGQTARGPAHLQIKAVTYHQLAIVQEETGWKAEVFFDI